MKEHPFLSKKNEHQLIASDLLKETTHNQKSTTPAQG
jgi:hypothetical protein